MCVCVCVVVVVVVMVMVMVMVCVCVVAVVVVVVVVVCVCVCVVCVCVGFHRCRENMLLCESQEACICQVLAGGRQARNARLVVQSVYGTASRRRQRGRLLLGFLARLGLQERFGVAVRVAAIGREICS